MPYALIARSSGGIAHQTLSRMQHRNVLSDEHSTLRVFIFLKDLAMAGRNEGTLAFFGHVQERCAKIASLSPSQHDAAISKLCKETGLTPITIAPIVERYAHQRVPDYPSLAKQFCQRIGREKVRAMLATNHGIRDLKHNVQVMLTDERLSLTGPRVALIIDAIKAEFQTASPSELISLAH